MKNTSRMTRGFGLLILSIVLAVGIVAPGAVMAQTTSTITLFSGNGAIGSLDPINQASSDGGNSWQPAGIVAPSSGYNVIPGTNYIFCGNTIYDPCGASYLKITKFRTTFPLPAGFANPSITVEAHADNAATIFLNGTQIGQQPQLEIQSNFRDPTEVFTSTNASLFQPGINTLEFDLLNFSGPAGLDYKATVTYSDAMPPRAECLPTSNPSGKNVPAAGTNPKSGQNPDGFYQLLGSDNVAVASIVVRDSNSSFVSNPFNNDDKVKITQAPGATPSDSRPGPGVMVSHLTLKGDGILRVTDTSGNVTEVTCRVAPLPK